MFAPTERLTRVGIADFSEDGGVTSAGGAGQIVGVLMKRNVRENGERECLFRISGYTECTECARGDDFERRQKRRQIGDQQGIACAAAGNDQFFDATNAGENKCCARLCNRCCGERGCGVNQISRCDAAALGERDETRRVLRSKFLAAGGLGRRFAKVGMREKLR